GSKDRFIRLGLALILIGCSIWKSSWILLFFGIFTLLEAFFSWCVLYQLLGKNSCPINRKK
ncbi:MAG: YgaP family membrane protein, partial [Candidatus Rhabdochlamydia sp.]